MSHPIPSRAPGALPLLLALLAAAPGAGCLAYNDECQAVVDSPREVIGYLDEQVYLDKPNTRTAPNAIGQMAADAFLHALDDQPDKAVVAVINGGNIRAEGVCITRNTLLPGPLKKGVLYEVLPFNNQVMGLDVTRTELRLLMEAGVSALPKVGEPVLNPPGRFMDISEGSSMEVDCSKPAGSRVVRMQVAGKDILTGNPDEKFRLAITKFLVFEGEGSSDILASHGTDLSRNPVTAQLQGGYDNRLAEQYMKDHYDKRQGQPGLTLDPNRLKLDNCATPPQPAG